MDAFPAEALAPLGRALAEHHAGRRGGTLVVHVAGFDPEPLPVGHFFRDAAEGDPIDRAALAHARGSVLDVGACAGAHAVPLVRAGHAVTALDVLPDAVQILLARGVLDARLGSVWELAPEARFDTVLALMNGTALAGTSRRLVPLLARLRAWTTPTGALLIDSTEMDPGRSVELHYQLEYEGERGAPFPQLFVDEAALGRAALRAGWTAVEVIARDEARYLARLSRAETP